MGTIDSLSAVEISCFVGLQKPVSQWAIRQPGDSVCHKISSHVNFPPKVWRMFVYEILVGRRAEVCKGLICKTSGLEAVCRKIVVFNEKTDTWCP